MRELKALPYPHVVLASGLDLQTSSFALDLFTEWSFTSQSLALFALEAQTRIAFVFALVFVNLEFVRDARICDMCYL